MLKRKNRLSKITKRAGEKKYFSPLFIVRISDNKDGKTRFGLIVSKKIDKRAVVRNRTKRILRMVAEELLEDLIDKDVVIIAKKSLIFTEKEMAAKELRSVLKK